MFVVVSGIIDRRFVISQMLRNIVQEKIIIRLGIS